MVENKIKLPDEFVELSYEEGELSGSGNVKWTRTDTNAALKWGLGVISGIGFTGCVAYLI